MIIETILSPSKPLLDTARVMPCYNLFYYLCKNKLRIYLILAALTGSLGVHELNLLIVKSVFKISSLMSLFYACEFTCKNLIL
jgi:hypothetical protein